MAKDMVMVEEKDVKVETPIAASYNDQIRPLLDAVDRLRRLQVMKEGIQLPTIVVVGDQSSGKSSVLESLAGISLPRGQGICTRVPLIMRLQDNPSADPQLQLEYRDKVLPTTEDGIADDINFATEQIAGCGKCISGEPLTLVVKKKGVPDLTMVDLPGITRVPVHGQPDDIYEQISSIIMEYISPSESIILNVLSATVDFTTCESIRMSQRVDKTGDRTLAVVTKSDRAPEGLLEKVTADDVNIGLGYVCVRNRVGDETYEQARAEEATLFVTHPLLSKIDKSIVGIPVLAQKLVQIQAAGIAKCLPDIVSKINEKLSRSNAELNDMPQNLTNVCDAMKTFMRIVSLAKESLRKVLVRGEYNDFPYDKSMHGAARLSELLNTYREEMPAALPADSRAFLMEEVMELNECKGLTLSNFLPRTAFLNILRRKLEKIAHTPANFILRVWAYIEDVLLKIIMQHSENYPPLQAIMRRAAYNVIEMKRNMSLEYVKVMIQMEKLADFTSNPNYCCTWANLMEQLNTFMVAVENNLQPTKVRLKLVGEVDVAHLRTHKKMAEQAFDMRMRLLSYWQSISLRIVDSLALHIICAVNQLVEEDMEVMVTEEVLEGNRLERMLEESPATAGKRQRLMDSIKLLKESKEVVANIMNRISLHEDYDICF